MNDSKDDLTLTQKTLQNIGVSGGATIISKLLGTVSTIILARLLNPIDFSIIGISMVLLGFVNQFSDIGFYAAVVQRKDKIKEAQYTGLYLRIFLSLIVTSVLFFLAPFWAQFYETKEITNVVRISLISMLIAPYSFIPSTHFLRNLEFKKTALISISQNITYVIVTIIMAFAGFRYWSIVWGTVSGSIVSVIVSCVIFPWQIKFKLNPHIAKELFSFGKFILLSGLILFLISNIDNMIIGKVGGMILLGFYVMAYKWGLWVKDNLAKVVGGVMFPTFSKIQDNVERLKRAYLQSLKYYSIVIFPISLGFLAVTPEFIEVILGAKWIPSTTSMQILCIAGLCQALGILDRDIINSKGLPKINTKIDFVYLVVITSLLYPFVKFWGIIGGSLAVLVSAILVKSVQFFIVKRIIKVKIKEILKTLVVPMSCALIMLASIIVMRQQLSKTSFYTWQRFIMLITFGTLVYIIPLMLFGKKDILMIYKKLKERGVSI